VAGVGDGDRLASNSPQVGIPVTDQREVSFSDQ